MVLNLSDHDSVHSHNAPLEGSGDHASVPSPESPRGHDSLPAAAIVQRAALAQHLAFVQQREEERQMEEEKQRDREVKREAECRQQNGSDRDAIADRERYHGENERYLRDDDRKSPLKRHHVTEETPLDFSVRRQDSGDSIRSTSSNLDSVGEPAPISPISHPEETPSLVRRSSSSSTEPLSPGPMNYKHEDKIGEPRLGLPGMPMGVTFPPLPGQLPPGFPLNMMANFNLLQNFQGRNQETKALNAQNDKNTARPFKAYPKDPLSLPLGYFGLPGVPPLPGIDQATAKAFSGVQNTEEMFKQYREYVMKRMEQERHPEMRRKSPTKPPVSHESMSRNGTAPLSPPPYGSPQLSPEGKHHQNRQQQLPPLSPARITQLSQTMLSPLRAGPHHHQSSVITPNPNTAQDISHCTQHQSVENGLKLPLSPDDSLNGMGNDDNEHQQQQKSAARKRRNNSSCDGNVIKDEAYWERRRKNNEAAKRSRDSRRAKEDEIAIRAAFLEQENLKLRVEVTALKNETAKLRCMLYNS